MFTVEELLDVLPIGFKESRNFSKKQKIVMGQLRMLNGLDESKRNGYCYRSNVDLCNDCGIESEHTLIAAVRKLEVNGLISRKKGSRADGASEYIIFEDKLNDYHDNNTANCSVNCSDIEITAKKIDRDCSVNCSTDTDIELDIDKDIEIIIYNILNNDINKNILINKLNNILEESKREKELDEYQLETTESLASTPTEELSQASPTDVSTVTEPLEEETQIPTEDELYQRWIKSLEPLINDYPKASSLTELDSLKDNTIQAMREYNDEHQLDNDSLSWRIAGFIAERYSIQRERIETKNQKMAKLFKFQSSQLD